MSAPQALTGNLADGGIFDFAVSVPEGFFDFVNDDIGVGIAYREDQGLSGKVRINVLGERLRRLR